MFCEKCGREIPTDSLFCEYCGALVIDADKEYLYDSSGREQKHNKKIIIFVIVLIVITAIASLIVFFAIQKSDKKTDISTTTTNPSYQTEIADESNEFDNNEYEESEKLQYDESSDYILPKSSEEIIDYSNISTLTDRELMLARNEIYARHGRIFTDRDVKKYFESKDWYSGIISPEDFSESLLNSCEKENVQRITEEESNRGIKY